MRPIWIFLLLRSKKALFLMTMICVLMSGCKSGTNVLSLRQAAVEIQEIELRYSSKDGDTVLYTLAGDEILGFVDGFTQMKVYKHWSPSGSYGYYVVYVYYLNEDVEIIGTDACGYCASSADEVEYDGWHYVEYGELYDLFAQYVDKNKMPFIE